MSQMQAVPGAPSAAEVKAVLDAAKSLRSRMGGMAIKVKAPFVPKIKHESECVFDLDEIILQPTLEASRVSDPSAVYENGDQSGIYVLFSTTPFILSDVAEDGTEKAVYQVGIGGASSLALSFKPLLDVQDGRTVPQRAKYDWFPHLFDAKGKARPNWQLDALKVVEDCTYQRLDSGDFMHEHYIQHVAWVERNSIGSETTTAATAG